MSFILLDDFIEMVYGYGFVKAYYPSLILMLAASIFGVSSSVNPLLLANNKPFYSSKVTLISSSVSLTLCAMSTLKLGILGASISVLVGAIITFSMRFFYLNLLKKTNYENK